MYNELMEEALAEAYASADQDIIPLLTVEIVHRSFEEPVRLLRWPLSGPEPEEFYCRLEESSIYDPGKLVKFIGVPFEAVTPEKSKDTTGEFTFRVPNIGDMLDEHLEAAALNGGTITAVFREYIKGEEAEGPAVWLPGINLRNPEIEASSGALVVKGVVLDWINRKYGRKYTPTKYPALV